MPKYVFTGDDLTDFPTLGRTLKPGQSVTTKKAIKHPHLRQVSEAEPKKAAPKKARKRATRNHGSTPMAPPSLTAPVIPAASAETAPVDRQAQPAPPAADNKE